jgi:predicted HicB family RNase H-like nuclease
MNETLIYRGLTARPTFDPHDKVFVGRVLGTNDVIAFHGETASECEHNFHVVVDGYLAALQQPAEGNS